MHVSWEQVPSYVVQQHQSYRKRGPASTDCTRSKFSCSKLPENKVRTCGEGGAGAGAAHLKVPRVPARWLYHNSAHEAHVDQKNKVVTTPAFMCQAALHHIHDGIGAMVQKVLELTGK